MKVWSAMFVILLELLSEITFADTNNPLVTKASYETLTFDKISNKAVDQNLVRNIREKLINDNALSKSGKNIQIIVVGKEITLKGPVTSERERKRIVNLATIVSENHSIRNQMEVSNE